MKTVILKKSNTSIRLSGRFGTKFLVSDANNVMEFGDKDFLEVEKILLPYIMAGDVEVVDGKIETPQQVVQEPVVQEPVVNEESSIEQESKSKRKSNGN